MLPKMMKKFGQSLDHHSASPDRLEKCKSCFKLRTFSDPPPFSTLWVGRKELLRDVGGEKVGRRVSTEQESNADNSDQYRPGTTLRRTCRRMCWTGWAGR